MAAEVEELEGALGAGAGGYVAAVVGGWVSGRLRGGKGMDGAYTCGLAWRGR